MTEHSPNTKPERQLPMDEKVSQIIQNAANMAFAKGPSDTDRLLEIPGQVVGAAIRAWRDRADYLPGVLFSDPAWIMILELLHAEIEQRRMTASNLCSTSGTAANTASRWLTALEEQSLVVRETGPLDPANRFVDLTPKASAALRRYFRDVAQDR